MRSVERLGLIVVLGIVLSAGVLAGFGPRDLWVAAALGAGFLAATVVAWSATIRLMLRDRRSRRLIATGVAVFVATTIWLYFVLVDYPSIQRCLLALALAWLLTPFGTLVAAAAGEKLLGGAHRDGRL